MGTPYVLEEERTISMNDDDSWRMDYEIVKDSNRNKPGAFERSVQFLLKCVDDTGATSDQNVEEHTDTVDVLLTANNGQESLIEGLECDGESVFWYMEHQDIEELYEWVDRLTWDDGAGCGIECEIWFHSEESINDALATAPIMEWLQPISFELFSDTKGETLGQNMDDNLEVEIEMIGVDLAYCEAKFVGMGPESAFPHSHYESEE